MKRKFFLHTLKGSTGILKLETLTTHYDYNAQQHVPTHPEKVVPDSCPATVLLWKNPLAKSGPELQTVKLSARIERMRGYGEGYRTLRFDPVSLVEVKRLSRQFDSEHGAGHGWYAVCGELTDPAETP